MFLLILIAAVASALMALWRLVPEGPELSEEELRQEFAEHFLGPKWTPIKEGEAVDPAWNSWRA